MLLLLASVLVGACTGIITQPEGSEPEPGSSSSFVCEKPDVVNAGSSPLRRLTRFEFDNTVRDLLGDASAPASDFTPDEAVAGFDANSVAAISKQQIEDFLDAAEKLAKTAVANQLTSLVDCNVEDDTCARSFIAAFGRRAFRRPLSEEEQHDFFALYSTSRSSWNAKTGIELVVRALLSSPSFLYLVETPRAGETGPGVVRVDAHTLAVRLSYFLWSSMPDDALFAAVDAGELDTPEGIEIQARRMLADARAEQTVASFHDQWLGIANLTEATKDAELFPEFDGTLAASMQEETRRFTRHVILEDDARLTTLLTAGYSFVDAPLAELYGVSAPSTPFEKTDLEPTERAGLLTQASVMTAHSGASETSWVHRGKLVRERFLCDTIAPPPPGVEATEAKNPGRLTDPTCSGCHLKMDPIGLGFDAYSPIGNYRTVDELGETVSTAGEVVAFDESTDAAGKFEGAVELAHALALSKDVGRCVALQWFRYANRRLETAEDACSVQALQNDFENSGRDIRELMIAITKTDSFRHRALAK